MLKFSVVVVVFVVILFSLLLLLFCIFFFSSTRIIARLHCSSSIDCVRGHVSYSRAVLQSRWLYNVAGCLLFVSYISHDYNLRERALINVVMIPYVIQLRVIRACAKCISHAKP